MGDGGLIRRTDNGGMSWEVQASGTSAALFSVNFLDGATGYCAGTGGTILKTTNGGAATPLGPAQTVPMRDIAPAGLAVTAHNNILAATATINSVVVSNAPPPVPAPTMAFGVFRQLWTGISGGGSLDGLTNTASNPTWPNNPNAS